MPGDAGEVNRMFTGAEPRKVLLGSRFAACQFDMFFAGHFEASTFMLRMVAL